MIKAEKKVYDLLTKYRIVLGFIFITLLNLYLRKVLVWWSDEDAINYYVGHEHMIQGSLWWFIMMRSVGLPILPVHFMKWVATAGDFMLAIVGALAVADSGKNSSGSFADRILSMIRSDSSLVFYSIMIINPFTVLRSMRWSMLDSWGIALFLAAYVLVRKDLFKAFFYALGILFAPFLIIPLCFELWCGKKELTAAGVIALTVLVSGILGVINGFGFRAGFMGQVYFLSYDPMTGLSFEDGLGWLCAVLPLYVLPGLSMVFFKIVNGSLKIRFRED